MKAIKGATQSTFKRTRRTKGKKLACRVSATNASGTFRLFSPSVPG
jgi:hypothetical protein